MSLRGADCAPLLIRATKRRAARPLHDPGNHRAIERGSNLQAARRGGLIKPAKPAGERENTAALTPSLGARSRLSAREFSKPALDSSRERVRCIVVVVGSTRSTA